MHPEFYRPARRSRGTCARLLCVCVVALAAMGSSVASASASGGPVAASAPIAPAEAQALGLLLTVLRVQYASADPTHEPALAALSRVLADGIQGRVLESQALLRARDPVRMARVVGALHRITELLGETTVRYQPWPLSLQIDALSERAQRELDAMLHPPKPPLRPYEAIAAALEQVSSAAAATSSQSAAVANSQDDRLTGAAAADSQRARFAALRAYALYAAGPGQRLAGDPALNGKVTSELLMGSASAPALLELLARGDPPSAVGHALAAVRADMGLVAEALAEVTISHTTIVIDAAIIVFREGLEAVLILAAITASFVGAKAHLRRPVFIGALAGLLATALTWVIAQMILHLLGDGGLELQAVTGLIAIGVLLLITNWFFHRIYWSEWISRFNRRRKAIERWNRLGFVSGQVLGFVLLGLSSVYREGLETVLFLQALQTSAGTGTTVLGAGIGLGGALLVGGLTFKLQRRLPFKRMLILTGVLIALVLAVMVGTTVHNLQGIGWLASTPTSFRVPLSWSIWLGIYPTWQGIGLQAGALVFVVGSYFAAREIQIKRPQRRAQRKIGYAAPLS
jgi:high-affinity iron transporter